MIDLLEAIKERHSVRSYTDKKIEGSIKENLLEMINECNKESGLNIQACFNEPNAFASLISRYGKFSNVKNYIALVGPDNDDLQEKCGYYGEKIVLYAQQLGLNTCWVALTYNRWKCPCVINPGEKLCLVIAIGFGTTKGILHKIKSIKDTSTVEGDMPKWFKNGMESVLLAPTAINQQKFHYTLKGNTVSAKAGLSFFSKVDLGITKYHFEIGAGKENFKWL